MVRTINLREMPEDLVRRAKARAALEGVSLKAFVIDALEAAVSMDLDAAETGNRKRSKKGNKKEKKKDKKRKR